MEPVLQLSRYLIGQPSHLSIIPRCQKEGFQPTVKPQIQEEQCILCLYHGTMEQLFTLADLLEGSSQFAHQVYMYFVDVEKACILVPKESLVGVGMGALCTGAAATRRLVHV